MHVLAAAALASGLGLAAAGAEAQSRPTYEQTVGYVKERTEGMHADGFDRYRQTVDFPQRCKMRITVEHGRSGAVISTIVADVDLGKLDLARMATRAGGNYSLIPAQSGAITRELSYPPENRRAMDRARGEPQRFACDATGCRSRQPTVVTDYHTLRTHGMGSAAENEVTARGLRHLFELCGSSKPLF